MTTYLVDQSSFVNLNAPGAVRVTHMDLSLIVDFFANCLHGSVVFSIEDVHHHNSSSAGGSNDVKRMLILDTRDLTIQGIEDATDTTNKTATALSYSLNEDRRHSTLGVPLEVEVSASTRLVRVQYTTAGGSALQWLNPEQTSSQSFPFLFSQCEAIHARSMLPCQDLCQVKSSYHAVIQYPRRLTALMSAQRIGETRPVGHNKNLLPSLPQSLASDGWAEQEFTQTNPIPAYLVAIVCGELEGKSIGPRSTVWAEPAVVDKAAWEFANTERMIQVAEARCGPYRWGVYDLLVLPPSFPYGGMENPCLTFVSPTLLAGDRSQEGVIAHELAHSWSGNLATNATWDHFWINEGLTVYTETKIVHALFGSECSAIRTAEGIQHLEVDVQRMGCSHRFCCLCPRYAFGEDPDDAFSSVPYEKGSALFWRLETLVGGDTVLQPVLKEFFDHFAFGTVSSQELQAFFIARFPFLADTMDWEMWFHTPGMPPVLPPIDPEPIRAAEALAHLWISKDNDEALLSEVASSKDAFIAWPSAKKSLMLGTIVEAVRNGTLSHHLSPARCKLMSELYTLLESNCELRCTFIGLWFAQYSPATSSQLDSSLVTAAKALVSEQGRMKFTRPTYRAWFAVDADGARATFKALQDRYHPICAKMVARDLGL